MYNTSNYLVFEWNTMGFQVNGVLNIIDKNTINNTGL